MIFLISSNSVPTIIPTSALACGFCLRQSRYYLVVPKQKCTAASCELRTYWDIEGAGGGPTDGGGMSPPRGQPCGFLQVEVEVRRNAAGGFDEISWDTAITEIAAKLNTLRETGSDQSFG
jgi:hypothetical protein